jgi:Family of unknown function (DUF5946)
VLSPCPGCGALFPPYDGPTHRYIGASAGCWALLTWSVITRNPDATDLVSRSRIPETVVQIPTSSEASSLDSLLGDAYGVQHHGEDSPQAIQSIAGHLLNLHGIISGKTTRPGWALGRALRIRGVFHKLDPPAIGSALTIRHLFPGGGVVTPVTHTQYALSVYEAWMALHRFTVEKWYERYVVPDRVAADGKPNNVLQRTLEDSGR